MIQKLTEVAYTGLNKKLMLATGGVVITLIGGLVGYTIFTGNTAEQQHESQAKLIKQPSNISVVVNNVLTLPVESQDNQNTSKAILVPIEQSKPQVAMMGSPNSNSRSGEQRKPEMFTSNDATPKNNNEANAITGTNTTVGTGVINSQLENQRSPYTIFAGSYIPAQMVNGINSDGDCSGEE
jgi:type IV secretory pathway VirB10-like protein